MSSAWIYQDQKQVAKRGTESASWYAAWIDPEGKQRCKSFGPGERGRTKAEAHRVIVQDQIERGSYKADSRKQWADFRAEFKSRIIDGQGASTALLTIEALDVFEKLARPKKMATIRTQTVDDFIAKRRKDRGRREGDTVSPATINRQLRHLKAALRVAHE